MPGYAGTCALTAIANLTKYLGDKAQSEGQVVNRYISNGWSDDVCVSSPKAAQPLFGVRPQKKTQLRQTLTTVQRGLTPINDLRQFAHSFRLPAASPHGDWLAGQDALDAANDERCQIAA